MMVLAMLFFAALSVAARIANEADYVVAATTFGAGYCAGVALVSYLFDRS